MVEISKEQIDKYGGLDADTQAFFDHFDEKPDRKIVEAGCHEEHAAHILTELGHRVVGIDLRNYDLKHPKTFEYVRHDICDLPSAFLTRHKETFDVAFSLSAIEHFGLGTYGEGIPQPYYDVIAMDVLWKLLRVGGTAYITVPYGKDHTDHGPHWRVYNKQSMKDRIIQKFEVVKTVYFASGQFTLGQKNFNINDEVTEEEANSFPGVPPHSTILVKLRKPDLALLAPDGR